MGIQKAYVHKQNNLSKLPTGSIILIYRKGNKSNAVKTSVVTRVGKIIAQYKKI